MNWMPYWILTTFFCGYFYFHIIIATSSGGYTHQTSTLQHYLAAILPTFITSTHIYSDRPANSISHYNLLWRLFSTPISSLQLPLANIVLLHHHCNLLWRFCYFYILFATYSGGHPTYIALFQPMPTLTIPATSISLLQPLLANIMLPYHHCNLLWRSSYFNVVVSLQPTLFQPMPTLTIPATSISLLQPLLANIMLPYHHCNLLWRSSYCNVVFATYSAGSSASTWRLHHQLLGRRIFVGLTSPWEAELYMARPEALLFFIFQILNLTPTLSTTLQSTGSIR